MTGKGISPSFLAAFIVAIGFSERNWSISLDRTLWAAIGG